MQKTLFVLRGTQEQCSLPSPTPMTTITNEAGVKREVKKLLDKHGWYHWMPPSNAYGRSGISDFNAVKGGRFLAIETKFGSNKPTPMQVRFMDAITAHGGTAITVTEKTLATLEDLLHTIG